MVRHLVVALLMLFVAAGAHAGDARLSATEVKDSRSTGQFFNELEIKLALTGDDVAGARGIRTLVTRAVDDTGRNLLRSDE